MSDQSNMARAMQSFALLGGMLVSTRPRQGRPPYQVSQTPNRK